MVPIQISHGLDNFGDELKNTHCNDQYCEAGADFLVG